jgi:RimJ/RimL family protein N-acetyltransferase
MQASWEKDGVSKWMAYERKGDRLAGRGGLSRLAPDRPVTQRIADVLEDHGDWLADRLELGWALRTESRGQGYATEIGRAGLEFAFGTLGAREVVAFTERHNLASRAVMQRLGMTLAGEFTAEGLVEGVPQVQPDAPFALYVIQA